MTINLFFRAFPAIALLSASVMIAQNFQTMPVTSGFTEDVIANGIGSASVSTTSDVDGVSFAFVARDFKLTSSSSDLTYGIPTNGIINSVVASTPGLSFQLADLSSNNSLKLATTGANGTLVFTTPKAAFKLYMLSTSGSGTSVVSATVTFTDNTTQTFSNISISDWFAGANFAIQGIGRINRDNNNLEPNSTNPRLYQTVLNIDAANQTKLIQSVTVTKSSGVGIPNIFAFSADAYTDCAAPTTNAATGVTANTAQISWTVPASNQTTGYDIYYSTSATTPANNVNPNYSNVTGTSYTLNNLAPSTTHYYWVRANCSTATGKSAWSFVKSFTTLCGAVVPAYTNNFSVFPGNCWTNALSGGTPNTGPTGTSNYWYQYSFLNGSSNPSARMNIYGSSKTGWLKTTAFNLSAGGYKVKFNYGVTTYSGTGTSAMDSDDVVHFLISNDGGSSWTILQTWDANNSPSNTSNEYVFDLANFTNANTVFAFYGSTGSLDENLDYNFYVDDFTVENTQLSTSEVSRQNKKISVHPNPFKDILYISDTRETKSVTVTDTTGRTVQVMEGSVKELDLSRLNSGLYFVTLYFKDGSHSTVKAIKK
ncbi:T9SS type A sorting domain-containing protein [Chryseobacterium indologenes]|uniref:T9SS type A sorting domain-containing protein n=1 Tax=Chryseobacterium indologenes TaxID=253 RepID=UPI0023E77CC6|nr:T9SS type A sorting domain-containing protein [Chryseobacterium indologenes]WET51763.1 T9SS type A sorting domain-containing protein [Chryseobacterium indologenes]